MRWGEVPDTYGNALEQGFTTFETEYRGIGGWNQVRSLFEKAVETKADALDIEYDLELDTGDVLLKERENGIDGYSAVLYEEIFDARRPLAKTPLSKNESFRVEYTGSHKPDEIGIPGNPEIVDVDGTNLRHAAD
jgi:hypothetical protein